MYPVLALAGALGATAAAQIAYKKYSQRRRPLYLLVAVALFGITPVLTYVAVKAFGIGLVYISTSITYIVVTISGYVVFAEQLTRRSILAMLLISLGILIYGLGLR